MNNNFNGTMKYQPVKDREIKVKEIISTIYDSLEAKGYNPLNQIIGYILSGDPTYITSHNNARNLIREIEREDLLEEVLEYYIKGEGIIK